MSRRFVTDSVPRSLLAAFVSSMLSMLSMTVSVRRGLMCCWGKSKPEVTVLPDDVIHHGGGLGDGTAGGAAHG